MLLRVGVSQNMTKGELLDKIIIFLDEQNSPKTIPLVFLLLIFMCTVHPSLKVALYMYFVGL